SSFAVAATADVENEAAVAAGGGGYLVSYTKGTVNPDVMAQLVTSSGTLNGGAITLCAGAGSQRQSSAAFVGGNFVVVWNNTPHGQTPYGARVPTAGAVLDSHVDDVGTAGGIALSTGKAESFPSIACDTSNCLVSWRDRRSYPTLAYDVYGQLINSSLA